MTGTPKGDRLKLLCLDAEGGFGGSSRSLFELIKHLDRERFDLEVWYRKDGPIGDRYKALGVAAHYHPEMPRVSSLTRFHVNVFVYLRFILDWLRSSSWRRRLLNRVSEVDHVHFNLESLFILAWWLRRNSRVRTTMHIRTNIWDNVFSRIQTRMIASSVDELVFITEMEKLNFEKLLGRPVEGHVVHNPVTIPEGSDGSLQSRDSTRFTIACLSNYSWLRGIDRLIDMALYEKRAGRNNIRFVVAGDMRLTSSTRKRLGRAASNCGTLEEYAEALRVDDRFRFLGFVSDPERVLECCDALIKPSREDNPWGRDILEAMAHAKPVIAHGTYRRFVETGKSGLLYATWRPQQVCEDIQQLARDPAKAARLGLEGQRRVRELCDGNSIGRRLASIWLRDKPPIVTL